MACIALILLLLTKLIASYLNLFSSLLLSLFFFFFFSRASSSSLLLFLFFSSSSSSFFFFFFFFFSPPSSSLLLFCSSSDNFHLHQRMHSGVRRCTICLTFSFTPAFLYFINELHHFFVSAFVFAWHLPCYLDRSFYTCSSTGVQRFWLFGLQHYWFPPTVKVRL